MVRRCLKNGTMHNGEEFCRQTNKIFRRNTGCISRKIGAVWQQKNRRLGVLTFFKQALIVDYLETGEYEKQLSPDTIKAYRINLRSLLTLQKVHGLIKIC